MMAPRILLVDDEGSVRFGFGEYLGGRGFVVECAPCAASALDKLESTEFALLITDLRLDGTGAAGGLDIVARARQLQPEMRVVVLTACDASFADEAFQRGADQFLQKPQPLSSVANLVEALLHDVRHSTRREPTPAPVRERSPAERGRGDRHD